MEEKEFVIRSKNTGPNSVFFEEIFDLNDEFYTIVVTPKNLLWKFGIRFINRKDRDSPNPSGGLNPPFHEILINVGNVLYGQLQTNFNIIEVFNMSHINLPTVSSKEQSDKYKELSDVEIRFQYNRLNNKVFYSILAKESFFLNDYIQFGEFVYDSIELVASSHNDDWQIDCSLKSGEYAIADRSNAETSVFAVGKINFRHGDMFDSEAIINSNVIILPASSNGTANSNTRNRATELKIPYPLKNETGGILLYEVSFDKKQLLAGYGYSVRDDSSSEDIIAKLCYNIIRILNDKNEIRKKFQVQGINLPILGSGAGGLNPVDVIKLYDLIFNSHSSPYRIIVNVLSANIFNLIRTEFAERLVYLREDHKKVKPSKIIELENELNIEIEASSFEVDLVGQILKLDLSQYRIKRIDFLNRITSLVSLNLNNIVVEDYSPLKYLTKLKSLFLNGCKLEDLSFIRSLKGLRVLDIGFNHLDDIKDISYLKKLEFLYLRGNNIHNINRLAALNRLNVLDLSYNEVEDIRPLQRLKYLRNLNISNNSISDISYLIDCSSLEILDISNNDIEDFDVLLGLPQIEYLKADNNPFLRSSDIILDDLDNHLASIHNYLSRQSEANKVLTKLPAKVLLLGNHASGKSSLVQYIQEGHLRRKTTSTHIIKIEKYPKKRAGIPDAIFFDFGGQDYYHGIYRAFLSVGAVYLILWNSEKNVNSQRVDVKGICTQDFTLSYWLAQKRYLENEKYYGAVDPALIIQTHADKNTRIPYASLSPNVSVKNEFYISLLSSYSENKFDNASNYYALKYLKASIIDLIESKRQERLEPVWYVDFITFILTMNSKSDFKGKSVSREILPYYRRNIQNRLEMLKDDLDQLHKQGLILYYKTDLPDRVWLNPVKLVEYIHDEILSDRFKKDCFRGIPVEDFDKKFDEGILRLLCKQKVIFKHLYGEFGEEYIIPNYLPLANETQNDFDLFTFGLNNPLFILKFSDFLPFGFVNQLICFFGKLPDKKKFWRDQLLFTLGGNAKILIQINFNFLEIRVFASFVKGFETEGQDYYTSYLFYCIIGLYWDLDLLELEDYLLLLQKKMNRDSFSPEELMFKKIQWFDNIYEREECRPLDLYISINDREFIRYMDLCALDSTVMINSFSKVEGGETFYPSNPIPIYPFRHFTNKKLNRRKKVVISYSKDDLRFVNQFLKYLLPLYEDELIESPWYCTMLVAGTEWNDEIRTKFEEADIIFFMISENLMATKYVLEVEIKNAIDKWDRNKSIRIVPILLVPYDFNRKGRYNLSRFVSLPYTLKAVNTFKNQHIAWYSIANAIKIMIMNDLSPEGDQEVLTKEYAKIYEAIVDGI